MNVFSGNLAKLKLIEVLRLLYTSKHTGLIEISTNDALVGEIYFTNGQIQHASYEDWLGEEAVYGLFSLSKGMFNFSSDESTDEETISLSTEEILLECITYANEWEIIRRVIPSAQSIFCLSTQSNREVSLRVEDWLVIQNIDGHRTVLEIVNNTHLGELFISKIIVRLSDLELIKFVGEKNNTEEIIDCVPMDVINLVEQKLIHAIGPMGAVILDDSSEILGYKRSQLPKDIMPALVEHLAEEISNENHRIKFEESMLEIMHKLSYQV